MSEDSPEQPPSDETKSVESPVPQSQPPERIGKYRILEKIGEGGMGVVYLAEQTESVRRKVALKIIKRGMDSKKVVARFEAERQALAMMDHPCVAKVFDAGTTADGRPYFAMEYVQGVPITEHCDRQRLTTRERLELFRKVCEGVQHAHQKAIIHRDLKPSNVLVSYQDGRATPKIIDFGVAKAIEHRLTEKTLFTEMGVLIGTPEYMSPEQAEMTGQNVDTRTDVYSLGVVLYELLVGALPFEPRELRQAGFDQIRRKIREEEPPKPSTRLSTLEGERSTESATRRRTDLSSLRRQLSGDLDWITMRALEKDRSRRYGSPTELAADIRRHLSDQPVEAGPPSGAYRAKKFVRRHRVGVAVAGGVGVLLLAVAATMTVQAGRIADERDRADQEAEAKGLVSEFLKDLFKVSDPGEARGNSITARELLDKGAEKIEGMLTQQPETRAELMATMGDVYHKLGLYAQAEPLLERALAERKRVLGDDHPNTLHSMNDLALLYHVQGRLDEAEPLYLETLETQKRVLGDDHPDTLASTNNLANLYSDQGRYDEAEPLYLENLEATKRVRGDDHQETLHSMNNLAVLYMDRVRYDEAEPLFLETLAIKKRVLGDDHPDTLWSMNNLAVLYRKQGRNEEAESLYLETLETRKRVLGDDHPDTLASMLNLAVLYHVQGRYDEAESLYLETSETQKRVLGDDHPNTLRSMSNLAGLYMDRDRYDDAAPLILETLAIKKRVLGDDHPDTLFSLNSLALLYKRQGRYDEAEPLYLETLETQKRVLGDDHPDTLTTLNNLAVLYKDQGRYDEAEPLYLETLETRKRVFGDGHANTAGSLYNLACFEAVRGDRAKAMGWLRQSVDAGLSNADWMPEDSDLESLHGPEFDALVDRARENAVRQRAE